MGVGNRPPDGFWLISCKNLRGWVGCLVGCRVGSVVCFMFVKMASGRTRQDKNYVRRGGQKISRPFFSFHVI